MNLRIGHSYDVHQLDVDRKLILGGVEIEHFQGLVGHSDADVLTHAIIEAIIGAMALGDIGSLYPDTDEKYKGISSLKLLEDVIKTMKENKYQILNIDSTIYAEKPLMKQHIPKMKQKLAKVMEIELDNLNIKATRGEKMGFVGRQEGMAAEAVVLLNRAENGVANEK